MNVFDCESSPRVLYLYLVLLHKNGAKSEIKVSKWNGVP